MMTLKETVYSLYRVALQEKISLLQSSLDDLKESGKNETKSTAGDKHETALAMLQLEQENIRNQLKEAIRQWDELEKIDPAKASYMAGKGSLIKTNRGYFFLSLALGKLKVYGNDIIALSTQSPLGNKFLGATAGHSVTINGKVYFIETVE
jgi:hypothetical protein